MTLQNHGYIRQAREERGLRREDNTPVGGPTLSFPNTACVSPQMSVSQGEAGIARLWFLVCWESPLKPGAIPSPSVVLILLLLGLLSYLRHDIVHCCCHPTAPALGLRAQPQPSGQGPQTEIELLRRGRPSLGPVLLWTFSSPQECGKFRSVEISIVPTIPSLSPCVDIDCLLTLRPCFPRRGRLQGPIHHKAGISPDLT